MTPMPTKFSHHIWIEQERQRYRKINWTWVSRILPCSQLDRCWHAWCHTWKAAVLLELFSNHFCHIAFICKNLVFFPDNEQPDTKGWSSPCWTRYSWPSQKFTSCGRDECGYGTWITLHRDWGENRGKVSNSRCWTSSIWTNDLWAIVQIRFLFVISNTSRNSQWKKGMWPPRRLPGFNSWVHYLQLEDDLGKRYSSSVPFATWMFSQEEVVIKAN